MEKTDIVRQLAGQEKVPLGVAMTVAHSYYDYDEYLRKNLPDNQAEKTVNLMKAKKYTLFEILLKDSPKALQELEELDLLD